MNDLFRPMVSEARVAKRVAYRQFLKERDGIADVSARTLSRREQGMQRYLHPPMTPRGLDHDLFARQYAHFDTRRVTPQNLLLLLTLVKVNGAEAFGVESSYPSALRRAEALQDDLELMLLIEETYHTKILLSCALLHGIVVSSAYRPPLSLRLLIGGIEHTPESVARPLTLAAEVLGTVLFLGLLKATREICREDGELRDAIEERLTDVLIDEIGHISFNRMCLDERGLARARKLLPWVCRGMKDAIPELSALGLDLSCTEIGDLLSARRLPEPVRRAAFIA